MEIKSSEVIPDARFIMLDPFRDDRGEFCATFSERTHTFSDGQGAPIAFVEDDISVTRRHTLRGLHGDDTTWKLMQCLLGEVQLVVVDVRQAAPTYLRWENLKLSEEVRQQVLVPPGCVVGHLTLTDRSIVSYKQSRQYRGAEEQLTVRWDDPKLGIPWEVEDPVVSHRDASAPLL